ncbi:MAG: DNA polymerase III subunit beta [Desulfovibrio sp.]|jgi:DNA polymerase-3 subunit beta|nr:DNA polymerase III subunit beta [Desulfovibrio sp.]
MKFTIAKEQIADGLQMAYGIIPSRSGSLFLRSLWMKVENQHLTIMASNGEVEYGAIFHADVQKDGTIGVQGREFIELVRKLGPGDLNFQLEENGTALFMDQEQQRFYEIPIVNTDWYTPLAEFPEEGAASFNAEIFREAIDKVEYCIVEGEENQKPVLEYISVQKSENDMVEICALNNNQFAVMAFENKSLADWLGEEGLFIHKKFLNDIQKWMDQGEAQINRNDNYVFFRKTDKTQALTIRSMKGTFPQYRGVFESVVSNKTTTVTLDRKETIAALERLVDFTSTTSPEVIIEFSETQARFNCQTQNIGKGQEILDITYSGTVDKIVFMLKQILPCLKHLSSKKIDLLIEAPGKPCAITGMNDENYKIIIMPCIFTEETYYEEKPA